MQFRPKPNGGADAEDDGADERHQFEAHICPKHHGFTLP